MAPEKSSSEPLMKPWQLILLRATIAGTALLFILAWWAPHVPKQMFVIPAAVGGLLLSCAWTWIVKRGKR